MVDYAAVAQVGGSVASGSWGAAAQQGAALAAEELSKTDFGAWAAETGQEMLAGASIGATAGLACGPLAPICSAVGAIVGALVALGIAIGELFEDEPNTVPCLVDDVGGKVMRPCYEMLGTTYGPAWTVAPNSFERSLSFPLGPNRLSMGKLVWTMRRIKEDGLGIQHLWRAQLAMGLQPTLMGLPRLEELDAYAEQLATRLPQLGTPAVRQFVSRYAARVGAGASMPQAYESLGVAPPAGGMARYNRTIALLQQEYASIPLPPQPGFGVAPMARPTTIRADVIARSILPRVRGLQRVGTTQAPQGDAVTRSGTAPAAAAEFPTGAVAGGGIGGVLLGGFLGYALAGGKGAAIGGGIGAVAGGGVGYALGKPSTAMASTAGGVGGQSGG
jgi:hypothetical protein